MRKLKLEIDTLRVESFDTTTIARARQGTVRANADAVEEDYEAITTPQSQDPSCFDTCKISCWGTCDASCGGTCEVSCDGNCSDLCTYGCTDGCTARTCLSGAPVCCA